MEGSPTGALARLQSNDPYPYFFIDEDYSRTLYPTFTKRKKLEFIHVVLECHLLDKTMRMATAVYRTLPTTR